MVNSKKKKKNIKGFLTSTKFLTGVFVLLIIVVFILVILCVVRNNDSEINGFANMSFSLTDNNNPIEFGINAATLSETDEYIFKVTNYKGNKINKKKTNYKVTIENKTNCIISVTINDLDDNVMTNQEGTELVDTLKANEKEAVYYHVKVKSSGELNSKDLIGVKIEAE